MKTRLLWIAILAVGGAALYFGLAQPHISTIPKRIRTQVPDIKPPTLPPLELPPLVIPPIPALPLPTLPPVEKI